MKAFDEWKSKIVFKMVSNENIRRLEIKKYQND